VDGPAPRLARLSGEAAILEGAELYEHIAPLEGPAYAEPSHLLGSGMGHGRATKRDCPRRGRKLPREEVDQGRLACAVGADERVDLVGLQLERDAVDRDHAAEVPRELLRREHGFSHGGLPTHARSARYRSSLLAGA